MLSKKFIFFQKYVFQVGTTVILVILPTPSKKISSTYQILREKQRQQSPTLETSFCTTDVFILILKISAMEFDYIKGKYNVFFTLLPAWELTQPYLWTVVFNFIYFASSYSVAIMFPAFGFYTHFSWEKLFRLELHSISWIKYNRKFRQNYTVYLRSCTIGKVRQNYTVISYDPCTTGSVRQYGTVYLRSSTIARGYKKLTLQSLHHRTTGSSDGIKLHSSDHVQPEIQTENCTVYLGSCTTGSLT